MTLQLPSVILGRAGIWIQFLWVGGLVSGSESQACAVHHVLPLWWW